MKPRQAWGRAPLVLVSLTVGCTGSIGAGSIENPSKEDPGVTGGGGSGGVAGDPVLPAIDVGQTGARRLTAYEYNNTVADLLHDTTRLAVSYLPVDQARPFDNDFTGQDPSGALIAGAEGLAEKVVQRALDPTNPDNARALIVTCKPAAPDDAACLRTVITTFGRRALRRPLTEEEITRYLALRSYGAEAGDFYLAVELVLRAMLQNPKFIYRIEIGEPLTDPSRPRRLTPYELATRISYFVIGSTPPDALLDRAEKAQLTTPDDRRRVAQELMADPKFPVFVDRFHALWLGYESLPVAVPDGALAGSMRAETSALIKRVVFDKKGDYFDLFRSTETLVDRTLAAQYGMPFTNTWAQYPASSLRKGILSHAGVLASAGIEGEDTSITERGLWMRGRVMCDDIPPPPANIKSTMLPTVSTCAGGVFGKHDAAVARIANCSPCHSMMDGVGLGLEIYDRLGANRRYEPALPPKKTATACPITGEGELLGADGATRTPFKGAAGLADALLADGKLQACAAKQVYRYGMGRQLGPSDAGALMKIQKDFGDAQNRFPELMLAIVASDAFTLVRSKELPP